MATRINRAIELLAADQAIYYMGAHSGHVLTHAQGVADAGTWADYINVGMEHGAFDMAGLAEYMRGLVEGGPTRSGHRTPAVIVEAPVNGIDEAQRALQCLAVPPDPRRAACTASCSARPKAPARCAPSSRPAATRTRRPGRMPRS